MVVQLSGANMSGGSKGAATLFARLKRPFAQASCPRRVRHVRSGDSIEDAREALRRPP